MIFLYVGLALLAIALAAPRSYPYTVDKCLRNDPANSAHMPSGIPAYLIVDRPSPGRRISVVALTTATLAAPPIASMIHFIVLRGSLAPSSETLPTKRHQGHEIAAPCHLVGFCITENRPSDIGGPFFPLRGVWSVRTHMGGRRGHLHGRLLLPRRSRQRPHATRDSGVRWAWRLRLHGGYVHKDHRMTHKTHFGYGQPMSAGVWTDARPAAKGPWHGAGRFEPRSYRPPIPRPMFSISAGQSP